MIVGQFFKRIFQSEINYYLISHPVIFLLSKRTIWIPVVSIYERSHLVINFILKRTNKLFGLRIIYQNTNM